MPQALSDCKSCVGIISKIETITDIFVNPVHFLEKVGKNIIWHFKDITGDIHQAKEDWETGKYREFGEFCGKITAVALSKTGEPMKVMGFFTRASGSCGDITKCIETSEKLSSLVQSLAKEFQGKFGFDNIKNIVTDIKDILEIIPTEFSACTEVPAEALKIVATWTKQFTNVVGTTEKIVKALWSHHSELYHDATDFTASCASGNYFQAGQDLADFIEIILGPAI